MLLLAAVYTWAGESGCAVPALDSLHRDVSRYVPCQPHLLEAAVIVMAEKLVCVNARVQLYASLSC